MQPAGALPASMWTIRGGKARRWPWLPCSSVRVTQLVEHRGDRRSSASIIDSSDAALQQVWRTPVQVLDDTPRQRVGGREQFETFLHVHVAVERERVARRAQRKSMISSSFTSSSGGSSDRGVTTRSRSSAGVANVAPRSREVCSTS